MKCNLITGPLASASLFAVLAACSGDFGGAMSGDDDVTTLIADDTATEYTASDATDDEGGEGGRLIELESEPVVRMHFGLDASPEEIDVAFDAAVADYLEGALTLKDTHDRWNFRTCTTTSERADAGTDDTVRLRVMFRTDFGTVTHAHVLNHSGDDREYGGTDCYLFNGDSIRGLDVPWVEVMRARLELEGTDGWHVQSFSIRLSPDDQTVDATGTSRLFASPETWLDNVVDIPFVSGPWDNTIWFDGIGRMTF